MGGGNYQWTWPRFIAATVALFAVGLVLGVALRGLL